MSFNSTHVITASLSCETVVYLISRGLDKRLIYPYFISLELLVVQVSDLRAIYLVCSLYVSCYTGIHIALISFC